MQKKNEFELYKIGWKRFDSAPTIFLSSQPNGSFLVEEEIQSSRIFQLTVEICQTGDSISVSMVFSEFLDVAQIY